MNDKENEEATRLHEDSFVFDFSPQGEPIPPTTQIRELVASTYRGDSLSESLRRLWAERLRELSDDPAERERTARDWRASGVDAVQVTLGSLELQTQDWEATMRDAAYWRRRAAIGGDMNICTTAAELLSARRAGRIGVMLGLQDTLQIGPDLRRLETLHGLGVRVIQLTYNRRNLVGDGCTERMQSGLSHFGVEMIRELNRLGIVVDLSHCGDGTTLDALEVSEQPVAFTHVACRAVYDHPRGKTDEQLRLLAERGGYAGIVAVPFFLGPDGGGLDVMVRHVAHAVEVAGPEHVGIATDWGVWSPDFPPELHERAMHVFQGTLGFGPEDGVELGVCLEGFTHWREWPGITHSLLAHGFSGDEVRGLLGRNWLHYLERSEATG